jgi:hypothetical protein
VIASPRNERRGYGGSMTAAADAHGTNGGGRRDPGGPGNQPDGPRTGALPACAVCCRTALPTDNVLVLWALERDGPIERWVCPSCSAAHVRSMEARLDASWW